MISEAARVFVAALRAGRLPLDRHACPAAARAVVRVDVNMINFMDVKSVSRDETLDFIWHQIIYRFVSLDTVTGLSGRHLDIVSP